MRAVTIITPHYHEETLAGDYYSISEMKHEMEDRRAIQVLHGEPGEKKLFALVEKQYELPIRYLAEEDENGEAQYTYFACHPIFDKYFEAVLNSKIALEQRNDELTRKNFDQYQYIRKLHTLPWYKAIWFLLTSRKRFM